VNEAICLPVDFAILSGGSFDTGLRPYSGGELEKKHRQDFE